MSKSEHDIDPFLEEPRKVTARFIATFIAPPLAIILFVGAVMTGLLPAMSGASNTGVFVLVGIPSLFFAIQVWLIDHYPLRLRILYLVYGISLIPLLALIAFSLATMPRILQDNQVVPTAEALISYASDHEYDEVRVVADRVPTFIDSDGERHIAQVSISNQNGSLVMVREHDMFIEADDELLESLGEELSVERNDCTKQEATKVCWVNSTLTIFLEDGSQAEEVALSPPALE